MAQEQSRFELNAGLVEGNGKCVIELKKDKQSLGLMLLDAAEVESWIRNLASLRAQMTEQVAPALDPSFRIEGPFDPAWRIPKDPQDGVRLLALRHPGLGWVAYGLPVKEAKKIGCWLSKPKI
ncbi:hypothetical protein RUE5091_03773 [Ruegeria denitrificans]|uniref:Uncharacterized protein n=1 Tax=Ruegeria denitrificans TaxID=1715692 RepID=A0A0P1II79_9RHOB|nr:hypothetical protein [Ruegeria denitrificans]CUK14606.1 hypothetical protein RUE5091_03773 [Ruegeria denitrificans]